MAINADGCWQPDLFPKQLEIFNCYKKYTLVCGPVKSTKTIGCLNRLMRHAWETPQARIGIFAKTVKSAFAGGVWSDLMEIVLPQWLNANIGLKVTKGPKVDGSTRLHYIWISNIHGGNSEIQLRSLDFDFDIEASLKSGRFSMFYFSELSNFGNRIVFDTSTERLRMPHLRDDQHMWLADTNPADEGENSWIYRLFYVERTAPDHPYPDVQAKFHLIECSLNDNLAMSSGERNEILARYAHDEDRKNRYCHGRWTTRTDAGLFSDVFLFDTHVIGNTRAFNEEDWEVLLPSETCSNLGTGSDLGSKNHAAHIIERVPAPQSLFLILDEIISINTMLSIEDFTQLWVDRLDFWEQYIRQNCHQNPIDRRDWSDSSAFNQFRAALGGFDHAVVNIASEGKINLQAAPKSKGSIFKRVDLLRRLLFQNRLFVSARCVHTIQMLGSLKKGKNKMDPVEDSPMTHVFDSLTYYLASELISELAENWMPRIGQAGGDQIISVRI